MIGIYTTQVDENKRSIEENQKKIQDNKSSIDDNREMIYENKTEIEKLREEYRWLSESAQARLERINKKLITIIGLLVGLLVVTNAAWIIGG